jgi:hypothetical protein
MLRNMVYMKIREKNLKVYRINNRRNDIQINGTN